MPKPTFSCLDPFEANCSRISEHPFFALVPHSLDSAVSYSVQDGVSGINIHTSRTGAKRPWGLSSRIVHTISFAFFVSIEPRSNDRKFCRAARNPDERVIHIIEVLEISYTLSPGIHALRNGAL